MMRLCAHVRMGSLTAYVAWVTEMETVPREDSDTDPATPPAIAVICCPGSEDRDGSSLHVHTVEHVFLNYPLTSDRSYIPKLNNHSYSFPFPFP